MAPRPKTTEEEKALQTTRSQARGEGKLTPTRQMLQKKLLARQTNAYTANTKNQGKEKALYPANPNLNLAPPQIGQPVSYGEASQRQTLPPPTPTPAPEKRMSFTEGLKILFTPVSQNKFPASVAQASKKRAYDFQDFMESGAKNSALRKNHYGGEPLAPTIKEELNQARAVNEDLMTPLELVQPNLKELEATKFSEGGYRRPGKDGGVYYQTPKGGEMTSAGGRLTPDQLREAGYNPANMSGSFGVMPSSNALGVDTSAMKPEERSAFNAKSYNDAADKLKAEREGAGNRRMTPNRSGQQVSSFDRDMLLKAYKRDLRGVMGETGHYGGTKKAKIKAINEYYKSALGLGVGDQEEAGKTERANIVADAALEREGMTQAGRLAATRMTADAKNNKVEIDVTSGQPYRLTDVGREWTNAEMVQKAEHWKSLTGKQAEEFAAAFLQQYNMMPNEVN